MFVPEDLQVRGKAPYLERLLGASRLTRLCELTTLTSAAASCNLLIHTE